MKKNLLILFVFCSQSAFSQWPQTIIIQQRPSINPALPALPDYSINVPSPLDAARQGFELGRAMREEEDRRSFIGQQRIQQQHNLQANTIANELMAYTAVNRPRAMGGTITWSSYYSGAFTIAEKISSSVKNQLYLVSAFREGIGMAQEYEAGRISKEDFEKWRENMNASMTRK
jgi:hypothetical protein